MEYCPHCMQPSGGAVCSHCGGEMNWTAAPGQLPLSTMLRGSENHTYLIGAARGQGGFGITYAALDLNDNRRVAIKEYYPSRCALRTPLNKVIPMTGQNENYNSGLKSFLEEAMMLSAVGALPSVVTVKDYFEANGTAYLVMEFVDGVPLHEIVNKRGKIPASELLPKLDPLLQDLAILHKARVIHRDISPDNLMLMPDGSLKLLDFGSARSVQDGKAMTVLLKAGFSPVEQYQSRGQGPWTDVYALAGTIYYCLTGVIPPTAVDRLDSDTLQPPNSLGANLTIPQEKALLWGLTIQPKARPADMEQFRQQLFGKSGPVQVEVPGRIKPPAYKETVLLKDVEKKPAPQVAVSPAPRPIVPHPVPHPVPHREEQTNKEEAPPGKQPKKKNVPLIVIASVAAFVVTTLVILLIIGLSEEDTPSPREDEDRIAYEEDTTPFKKPTESTPKGTEPAKPTEPIQTEPITGETEDGYLYSIDRGSRTCTITGYNGSSELLEIPNTVDEVPVTTIAEEAFANLTKVTRVTFGSNLKEIRDRAFSGCSSLKGFITSAICTASVNIFDGCPKMRYAFVRNGATVDDWTLPDSVCVYQHGMETGIGKLSFICMVDKDGVIYGATENDEIVVMDIPDDLMEVTITDKMEFSSGNVSPVTWIYEKALENVSFHTEISLPTETLFPYSLWRAVDWNFQDNDEQFTLSECWYYTCYLANGINLQRDSDRGEPDIIPDKALLKATMHRAGELSVSCDLTRPNGENWSTVLDEYDISWLYANTWHTTYTEPKGKIEDCVDSLIESWAPSSADIGNQYYNHVAIGFYFDYTTKTYYCNSMVIVE